MRKSGFCPNCNVWTEIDENHLYQKCWFCGDVLVEDQVVVRKLQTTTTRQDRENERELTELKEEIERIQEEIEENERKIAEIEAKNRDLEVVLLRAKKLLYEKQG